MPIRNHSVICIFPTISVILLLAGCAATPVVQHPMPERDYITHVIPANVEEFAIARGILYCPDSGKSRSDGFDAKRYGEALIRFCGYSYQTFQTEVNFLDLK